MSAKKDYFDCRSYLQLMWPKNPDDTKLKDDNFWMLEQYTKIADILGKSGKKYKNLDIGTGPIWSPSLCFVPILVSLQSSDYSSTNRQILLTEDIYYWTEYSKIVESLREIPGNYQSNLDHIDHLRRLSPPIDIDIKNNPISSEVDLKTYDLVTMHYVADSITNSPIEYFQLMTNVFESINPQSMPVLSVLTESPEWDDGAGNKFPSIPLSVNEVIKFLTKSGYKNILFQTTKKTETEDYSGTLLIIACQK